MKTILLEGPITIYEVSAIRETLLAAMDEHEDFIIDLSESAKWDLAGLQLMISCVKSGRSQGRIVQVIGVTKGCQEIAERSGLSDWLKTVGE
jgi:ABC-type transporter Mla MlaB component